MGSSDFAVSNACVEAYNKLRMARTYRYVIFTVDEGRKEVVVHKTSADDDYEAFVRDLPEKECRFAVYDFPYTVGGQQRSRIVFYRWSPESAAVKSKMIYASAEDAFRQRLDGVSIKLTATEAAEVSRETVLEKVRQ